MGGGTDQNGARAQKQAAINILSEDDPGNAHGRRAFEVQQERGHRGIRARQAKHPQKRAEDAARQDH